MMDYKLQISCMKMSVKQEIWYFVTFSFFLQYKDLLNLILYWTTKSGVKDLIYIGSYYLTKILS